MTENLREQIAELIDKATVSLAVNYKYSLSEIRNHRDEFRGYTSYWSCYFDAEKKQWCTFNRGAQQTLKYYNCEEDALVYIIKAIKSNEKYFYSRERFIEEIKKCQERMKLKVGIYFNEPNPGPSEDLYYVKGYENVHGFWRKYYSVYDDYYYFMPPISVNYRKEEDALYSMYDGMPLNKKMYMSIEEMKSEIIAASKKIRVIGITFDDCRKQPNMYGCCFDEAIGRYVYYETDDRNQLCGGTTSKHEEFCIAELYTKVMSRLKFEEEYYR